VEATPSTSPGAAVTTPSPGASEVAITPTPTFVG
jgi:hypothetical protein